MEWETPRVALVTFTDMREEGISSEAVERHLRDKQNELAAFLGANGVSAVDPLRELRTDSSPNYGVRSFSEIDLLMGILSKSRIDAAIIGSWTWSPPMLVKEFVRKFNRPIMYYTENDPMGRSLSQMSATCASLMEWSVNRFALTHERNFGNRKDLLSWVRGVHAAAAMRESAALLWGGTYAVKMERLQDDIPKLKSFMIRDILMEDQYVLISRAEKIIQTQKERIAAFYGWLTGNGLVMHRDKKMVTDQALAKQAALLLAARAVLLAHGVRRRHQGPPDVHAVPCHQSGGPFRVRRPRFRRRRPYRVRQLRRRVRFLGGELPESKRRLSAGGSDGKHPRTIRCGVQLLRS